MNHFEITRRLVELERRQVLMEQTNEQLLAEIAKLNEMINQLSASLFAMNS